MGGERSSGYRELCERIFRDWIAGSLKLPDWALPLLVNEQKSGEAEPSLAFCLEPYLTFGEQNQRVAFVTTNPGGGEWFQKRCEVDGTRGPLRSDSYAANAVRLATYYVNGAKISRFAKNRLQQMDDIARRLQPDLAPSLAGFTQFELLPFHSTTLPKDELERLVSLIPEYRSALAGELDRYEIVCAIANAKHPARNNRLVNLFASILGIDLATAEFMPLRYKNGKPTVGIFYVHAGDGRRVISSSDPYNQLPEKKLRPAMVEALRR